MPDIKHQFTGGRMNKDLDERLIPNGEYRDAMNIQVSTSEGSDVGTVQNILGNSLGCVGQLVSPFSQVIGSVADEKEDTLYWFVSGQNTTSINPTNDEILEAIIKDTPATTLEDILDGFEQGTTDTMYTIKDTIMRKKMGHDCEPVLVDTYAFLLAKNEGIDHYNGAGVGEFASSMITGVDAEITNLLQPGWEVMAISDSGTSLGTSTVQNILNISGISFQPEYDPTTSAVGGPIDYVRFGANKKSQTTPNEYDLVDKVIYIPTPYWTNQGIPVGAGITIQSNYIGGITITQNNPVVTSETIIYSENNDGANFTLLKLTLQNSFDWNNTFAGFDPTNIKDVSVRAVTNLSTNVSGASYLTRDPLDFIDGQTAIRNNISGTGTYSIIVQQGVPNGNLILSDIDINDIAEGDPLSTEYGGNRNFANNGDGLCIGDVDTNNNIITVEDCDTGVLQIPFMGYGPGVGGNLILESSKINTIQLSDGIDNINLSDAVAILFNANKNRVLQFNRANLITGVNVIDDMLFWTDNFSEPKKINITRSIEGTDSSGEIHTKIVNKKVEPPLGLKSVDGNNTEVPIKEDDIAVIKKSPKLRLAMDLDSGRDDDKNYSALMTISNTNNPNASSFIGSSGIFGRTNFSGMNTLPIDEPGNYQRSVISIELETDVEGRETFDLTDWEVGKIVVLKEFNEDGDAPSLPISDYRIKGTIEEWSYNKFYAEPGDPARVKISFDAIEGTPPEVPQNAVTLNYAVDLFDDDLKRLFKFKFPRFSYRYKYSDNEYSAFAPFTEIAFVPGSFDYHPKKGYNIGMTNRLKKLTLKNFVTDDMPKDVVAIDLLYKDDSSAKVYVVDTISPKDEAIISETNTDNLNFWKKNEYVIESDTIRALVPSNQLLRPWDNVPKKALAQDIVGNRIVYGNYVQGYNFTSAGAEIVPNLKYAIETNKTDRSLKSIKSLRDYQLGVVFTDKYGRETPVMTNNTGAFKLDKTESVNKNVLRVGLRGQDFPDGIEYYKFFIKETSGEYFNLPMDRWYDAADGNIWLSFQSTDRNKIDDDTYLILKKGEDSDSLITENARYKVLAIQNNAPEHIKTRTYNIGRVTVGTDDPDTDDINEQLFVNVSHFPLIGSNKFTCNREVFGAGNSLQNLPDITDDLFVDFEIRGENKKSNRYKITNVSKEDIDGGSKDFNFTIDRFFQSDIDFIFDGPPTSPSGIRSDVRVTFYKNVIENKPEFDGKFFVKIYSDNVFDKNIRNARQEEGEIQYNTISHKKIFYLPNDIKQVHKKNDYEVFKDGNDHIDTLIQKYVYLYGSDNIPNTKTAWLYNDHGDDNWRDEAGNAIQHIPIKYSYFRAFFKDDISNLWQSLAWHKNDYDQLLLDYDNMQTDDHGCMDGSTSKDEFLSRIPRWWKASFGCQEKHSKGDLGEHVMDVHACMAVDKKLRNRPEGYQDTYFIDEGEFMGSHRTSNWYNSAFNLSYDPELMKDDGGYGDRIHKVPTFHTNAGITNYSGEGRISLALGPINPVNDWFNHEDGSGENLWSFDRSSYGDANSFFSKITPGSQFRWKEDPTGTVYTIFGSTNLQTKNRFYAIDKDSSDIDYGNRDMEGERYNASHSRYKIPYLYDSANYTMGIRYSFRPAMKWDPTDQGSFGIISNSRKINGLIDADNSPDANGNYVLDSNGLRSVDFDGNKVLIAIEDFANSYDTKHEEPAPVTVGMALTHIGSSNIADWTKSDGSGQLSHKLIVNKIEQEGSNYVLTLHNYDRVGNPTDDEVGDKFSGVETLRFEQPAMNGLSVNSESNINFYHEDLNNEIRAVGYTLEFIEPMEREALLPENPSVWETEPKEGTDLDIYYEISENNPAFLSQDTIATAIPTGSQIFTESANWNTGKHIFVENTLFDEGDIIELNIPICGGGGSCVSSTDQTITPVEVGDNIRVQRPSGASFLVKVTEIIDPFDVTEVLDMDDVDGIFTRKLRLHKRLYTSYQTLTWHNCYSFGNGVESNRIGDTFNKPFISNGVSVSATLADKYEEEHRKYGLIWSGIYNSTSGTNNLNQFIQAEKITKDLNPIYGSIQKLHTRNSDLVALCEDKILRILANKDALYNADGNAQLTATNLVLGTATPFVGEYGISRNPESFASEAYRAYFTDKVRGTVMRLSKDGLTAISDHGMKDWFKDNLKLAAEIHGSYDDRKDEYNVTLIKPNLDTGGQEIVLGPGMSFFMPQFLIEGEKDTITFREDVKGWVSFKSFTPENAISCANEYFTFHNGQLWQHHVELFDDNNKEYNRNTFYDIHHPSSINVLINEDPSAVKIFNTINYEGSQAKIDQLLSYNTYQPGTDVVTGTYTDNQYYNIEDKLGWYVESVTTDQEKGGINEFIEKEGKWFNYIKGTFATSVDEFNNVEGGFYPSDNAFQGLGRVSNVQLSSALGCTNDSTIIGPDGNTYPAVINYNAAAIVDDGSCVSTALGCTDPLSDGTGLGPNAYNNVWNTDTNPTSCIYYGCTDPTAFNWSESANTNDGSCIAVVLGCTDSTMFGFNPNANVDDGSCVSFVYGCLDNTANNYCAACNADYTPSSCTYTVYGCIDQNSCDYDANANTDDGSCTYCNDVNADNYNSDDTCDDGCEYCMPAQSLPDDAVSVTDIDANSAKLNWDVYFNPMTITTPPSQIATAIPTGYEIHLTSDDGTQSIHTHNPGSLSYGQALTYALNNLEDDTTYTVELKTICANTVSTLSAPTTFTTPFVTVYGCTDNAACNYDPNANTPDDVCDFTTCAGCTDPTFLEYCGNCWDAANYTVVSDGSGSAWQIDDGSCSTYIVYGCTDPIAFNWDGGANVDDGSCVPVVTGCMDDTLGVNGTIAATNYNPNANTDDGSCTYDTNITAEWVLLSNGDAEFVVTVGNIPVGSSFDSVSGVMVGQNNSATVLGNNIYGTYFTQTLQAVLGTNTYSLGTVPASEIISNALAGSIYLHHQGFGINYQGQPLDLANVTFPGDTELIIVGCTDSNACNYDSTAFVGDGSCDLPFGCDDSNAVNYDSNVTCPDNSSCIYCTNDPGIPSASFSYATNSSNALQVSWVNAGTTTTNGSATLLNQNDWTLYKVEYQYKIPGNTWTAWQSTWGNTAATGYLNVGDPQDCGYTSINTPYWRVGSSGRISVYGDDTFDRGFGPNDGRFAQGVKWRFKIKNACTDCSTGTGSSWTSIHTLQQDIIQS